MYLKKGERRRANRAQNRANTKNHFTFTPLHNGWFQCNQIPGKDGKTKCPRQFRSQHYKKPPSTVCTSSAPRPQTLAWDHPVVQVGQYFCWICGKKYGTVPLGGDCYACGNRASVS